MKCFLDLDGVLVDFVGPACRFHGKGNPYTDGRGPYDTWKPLGMTRADFLLPLPAGFWENLPWTSDGREIMSVVEREFGAENVCILTAPSGFPGCAEGKIAWIARELPEFYRSGRYLLGPAKYFAAGPGKVLIDDSPDNTFSWRAAGGNTFLLPRPWNQKAGGDPLASLRGFLWRLHHERAA